MALTPIQKILVATNGSPSSRRAVEEAVELAAAEEAQVTALLVVSPSDRRVDVSRFGPAAFMTSHVLYPEVRDRALEEAATLAEEHGVRLEAEVWASGNPIEVILELARHRRPDLLIVGAGHRRRRKALKLARHAPCPVMIVTEHEELRNAA
jgi:nucleotide-binding universal stress UspA family protein